MRCPIGITFFSVKVVEKGTGANLVKTADANQTCFSPFCSNVVFTIVMFRNI